MKEVIKLIRVKHWIKTILIFIPLVFSKSFNYENVLITILGFFAFSFLTSFVYVINDIKDCEKDKLHPFKKNRPIASGKIKKSTAVIIACVMLVLSIGINTIINKSFINVASYFLLAYLLINLAYSFGLKDICIVDVILLAAGFIIRVYYGASLINIPVSDWLFLTILNASLFLGLGKRKKELQYNKKSRKVLEQYNALFLDKFQYLTLSLTLVFYSLWTINQNLKYLYLSVPIVIIILMRYCLIIEGSADDCYLV